MDHYLEKASKYLNDVVRELSKGKDHVWTIVLLIRR